MKKIKKNIPKIDTQEFLTRFKEFNRSNTITLFGMMKGITLSTFGYVLLNNLIKYGIVFDGRSIIYILLGASFIAMILTYDSAFFGSIFSSSIPNSISTFSIFSLSCFEFLIIVILLPIKNDSFIQLTIEEQVNYWFLFFAFFNLSGALVQYNETRILIKKEHFLEIELQKLVESYKKIDRTNLIMAGISGLFYLGVYFCFFSWKIKSIESQFALSLFALFILFSALISHHIQRRKIIIDILKLNDNKAST